jgi:hypothetical protein
MKSLALSLLVAVGLSLGAATALADTTRAASTPSSWLSAAAASMQQANLHAERAQQYRAAASVATEKAKLATKIAENDAKQGFSYEAGVEHEKALKYQQEAQTDLALAARETEIAAQLRAQARAEMARYQQMLGASAPASR